MYQNLWYNDLKVNSYLIVLYKYNTTCTYIYISEREENVKSDILHVYMALLKQTKLTSSNMNADIADEDSAMYLLQSQVS